MFASRLSGGDIDIIKNKEFESLLTGDEKTGVIKEKRAREIAQEIKADYAVFGSITTLAKSYSLDLSILSFERKEGSLEKISYVLSEEQFIPKMSDVAYQIRAIVEGKDIAIPKTAAATKMKDEPETSPMGIFSEIENKKKGPADLEKGLFFQETKESKGFKPTGKIDLDFSIMACAVGDLDGKDGAELVMLGRKNLFIYSKKGDTFTNIDSLKAGFGEDFLKVSIGDADNDGMPELYVTSRYGIRARTTVLGWNGAFKKRDRITGHVKAINNSLKDKTVLLFQGSKPDEFFQGPIYFMDYDQHGKLHKSDRIPGLKGAQFYTIILFDVDKEGGNEWVGLGEDSRLCVWDDSGNVIWKGTKDLGGTNNEIRIGSSAPGDLPPRVSFNINPLVTDINHDGEEEILVVENIPLIEHVADLKIYNKSNLIGYQIQGTDLSPSWETRDMDYCMIGMEKYGQSIFLAAQKAKVVNIIKKGSGLVMWFDLGQGLKK
ncbi:MAG: VCBS repeat-containing protein [Deltaproteobacteria bacterium]|nr:VCBS repeat-containing protein [Deltaproteobacteria bacterium]